MTDTSYVVFAAYDHKYVGYDTLLPGISYLYVDTKEDGSLYIVADPNEEQLAYISEQLEDAKVQELLNSTQASYDENWLLMKLCQNICQSLEWKDLRPWKQQKGRRLP